MNSHSVFDIKIVAGQAVFAIAMIWASFKVRYMPLPLPQLMLLFTFFVLANLINRSGQHDLFHATDIAMWWAGGVMTLAFLIYFTINAALIALILDAKAAFRKPDWLARHQWLVVGLAGVLIIGGVTYNGFVKSAEVLAETTEQASKKQIAEYEKFRKDIATRDSARAVNDSLNAVANAKLMAELADLKAANAAIRAGQVKNAAQLKTNSVRLQKALTEKPAGADGDKTALDTTQTINSKSPAHEPEPTPTFWQRLNPFRKKQAVRYLPADTGPSGPVGPSGCPIGTTDPTPTDTVYVYHSVPDSTEFSARYAPGVRNAEPKSGADQREIRTGLSTERSPAAERRTTTYRAGWPRH